MEELLEGLDESKGFGPGFRSLEMPDRRVSGGRSPFPVAGIHFFQSAGSPREAEDPERF